jgi:hypothetical protein
VLYFQKVTMFSVVTRSHRKRLSGEGWFVVFRRSREWRVKDWKRPPPHRTSFGFGNQRLTLARVQPQRIHAWVFSEALQHALDEIRERFGRGAIVKGRFAVKGFPPPQPF